MSYFSNFQTIEYNGRDCKNITSRTALSAKSIAKLNTYLPYDLPEGVRPSEVAFDYYGQPSYDWMVFFSNQIVDPYYDWPLSSQEFTDFITIKYGSIELANQGIKHYRVNYRTDSSTLTPSQYASQPDKIKYYWTEDKSDEFGVVSYKRKPLDHIIETNKVVQVTVTSTTGIERGERIYQYSGFTVQGSAEVLKVVDSTTLQIGKIIGSFITGAITTNQTNITTTITSQLTLADNISADVFVYWEPLSYFDYEFELNESKRSIYAIDVSLLDPMQEALGTLLENE